MNENHFNKSLKRKKTEQMHPIERTNRIIELKKREAENHKFAKVLNTKSALLESRKKWLDEHEEKLENWEERLDDLETKLNNREEKHKIKVAHFNRRLDELKFQFKQRKENLDKQESILDVREEMVNKVIKEMKGLVGEMKLERRKLAMLQHSDISNEFNYGYNTESCRLFNTPLLHDPIKPSAKPQDYIINANGQITEAWKSCLNLNDSLNLINDQPTFLDDLIMNKENIENPEQGVGKKR